METLGESVTPGVAKAAYKKAKKYIAKEYIQEITHLKRERDILIETAAQNLEMYEVMCRYVDRLEQENSSLKAEIEESKSLGEN